jgi:membrane associated rhomboid family serine protease
MTDFRPGRFQILPTVVKNLIIINSLIVFAQFVIGRMGIDIADYFGLHYWRSTYFKPWQYLTHMFLHGSYNNVNATIMHLFSNMFALWMFGSILENVWGPKKFLVFYLICGMGAAILHMGVVAWGFHDVNQDFLQYQAAPTLDNFTVFINDHGSGGSPVIGYLRHIQELWSTTPDANLSRQSISAIDQYIHGVTADGQYYPGIYDEATVGASGAVFGILFAFGYMFPNTLLYLYFLVPIKAKYVVAGYAVFELVTGIRNSAGDNVAHFAHLGGMLVAFILLKIWNRTDRKHFY